MKKIFGKLVETVRGLVKEVKITRTDRGFVLVIVPHVGPEVNINISLKVMEEAE